MGSDEQTRSKMKGKSANFPAHVERTPLRASAAAISEVNHRRLREETIGVWFFREVYFQDAHEKNFELARTVEAELEDWLVVSTDRKSRNEEGILFKKFPPMTSSYRGIVSSVAKRFKVTACGFGDDEVGRFLVLFSNPATFSAPILALEDFTPAKTYYVPPPPNPGSNKKRRRTSAHVETEYDFEGTELALVQDFSQWALKHSYSHSEADFEHEATAFECDIAGCHDHIVEISLTQATHSTHELDVLNRHISHQPDVKATRPISPESLAIVFGSKNTAQSFLSSTHTSVLCSDEGNTETLLPCKCQSMSVHQQRIRRVGSAGLGMLKKALESS
eukprot:c26885_g1_i1.p1 GENE.c26885_g1_i1~~c26885_g1_i1.p1  ORF type:complete len:334 (-),score=38.48 c26885_g1_i1:107-1108(-)